MFNLYIPLEWRKNIRGSLRNFLLIRNYIFVTNRQRTLRIVDFTNISKSLWFNNILIILTTVYNLLILLYPWKQNRKPRKYVVSFAVFSNWRIVLCSKLSNMYVHEFHSILVLIQFWFQALKKKTILTPFHITIVTYEEHNN